MLREEAGSRKYHSMPITTGSWQAGYFLDTSDSVGENATAAVATLPGFPEEGVQTALICFYEGVINAYIEAAEWTGWDGWTLAAVWAQPAWHGGTGGVGHVKAYCTTNP